MDKRLFTSESVTEGHPDKVCDAVSDAILDALMAQDPMSRVACETAACTGFVLVTGEITSKADIDIPKIVRQTLNEIGYNDAATGFDGNTCAVMVAVDEQSADIAMGVDKALEAKENKMSDEELEAIGVAQPTSVMVNTFGTGKISDEKLVEIIRENFDLRPAGIIKMLDLRRPIYKQTAAYGHFGRNDLNLPWEALDKADELKKYL